MSDAALSELRLARFRERQYWRLMAAHGDCRDPMHPGCPRCEDADGEKLDEEEEETA